MIASKLGSAVPQIHQKLLTDEAEVFSRRYVTKLDVGTSLAVIKRSLGTDLFAFLKKMRANTACPINGFPQTYFERIKSALDKMQDKGHLEYHWQLSGIVMDGSPYSGMRGTLTLNVSQALYVAIQDA